MVLSLRTLEGAQSAQPSQAARPIVKWAGGKQQMLEHLLAKAPKKYNRYIEPFVGGGALFFALAPNDAVIADSNPELINLYEVVAHDVEALIAWLQTYKTDRQTFYDVRAQRPEELSDVERAARFVYLNRTCFNGLYRVNKRGQFNVPYGKYKNPRICDDAGLRAASRVLANATILRGDYAAILEQCGFDGDLVFLDPPYLPISEYSDFKRYTKDQFREEDHRKLADVAAMLCERGAHVLLTNSNHELVYQLYKPFDIEVVQTRRNINSVASRRGIGEDVIVDIKPRRRMLITVVPLPLSPQVAKYPATRFMGSKQNLLPDIWQAAAAFKPSTVLDLFSGSGSVSYLFKAQGAEVYSNDYMALSATFSRAMVENNTILLTADEVDSLCYDKGDSDGFVATTFDGLYFTKEENAFIDIVRANIKRLDSDVKKALATASLVRACMKKRPRGIFTYTGFRYDDGRRDLQLSFKEQFIAAVEAVNGAVFDNGRRNIAMQSDAMECDLRADLVYIDPPYYSPLSDNEYVRRYHFVEGLARDWQGVNLQTHTKTRKFKGYPTPFKTERGAEEALDSLFNRFRDSILLVSYSSNSLPNRETITSIMARYKKTVDVVSLNHQYSFGNQPHKVGNENNKVSEYLFIGA